MMRRVLAVVSVFALATVARAEGTLSWGDPAPKLQVKEFVKGDPVKEFEKGKLYVVEFWATWCGPCRVSIPHLTELAKKQKDVTFIGVSVWENDQDKVKPFVEDMGNKMGYTVAMDEVPEGKKGSDGVMAKTWMTAAEQNGIPTAFIINKDGKVAWIGHPMRMEKPLEKIVAGDWDLKAEAAKAKAEAEAAKKAQQMMGALVRGLRSGDVSDAMSAVDTFVKDRPAAKPMLAQQLNQLAWSVVDPDRVKGNKPPAKQLQAAVELATKAVELTDSKDAAIMDTLAQAHFVNGDVTKAIEVEEKAVKLDSPDQQKQELKERLETFKKAKEKEKDGQ
jgi:thiol-disulfide isomerase/thioredoxin